MIRRNELGFSCKSSLEMNALLRHAGVAALRGSSERVLQEMFAILCTLLNRIW